MFFFVLFFLDLLHFNFSYQTSLNLLKSSRSTLTVGGPEGNVGAGDNYDFYGERVHVVDQENAAPYF